MSAGKKVASGLVSTLASLVLTIAFVVSIANVMVASMSHVGESAAAVVKQVSADPASLNSIVDEFAKNTDAKFASQINKNRAQINEAIASLGSSQEFRDLIASTLDQISKATLDGAPSVTVDFSKIANVVATKVNAAAKSTVISQKDIASLKPTVLDLSKQSKNITNIKSKIHLALLIWVLWLLLVLLGFWLRGIKAVRTFGFQLLTLGVIGLAIKFLTPTIVDKVLKNSSGAAYQRKVIPEVVNSLGSPIFTLSIAFSVIGAVLVTVAIVISRKRKVAVAI